jgi:hypothetical protein
VFLVAVLANSTTSTENRLLYSVLLSTFLRVEELLLFTLVVVGRAFESD